MTHINTTAQSTSLVPAQPTGLVGDIKRFSEVVDLKVDKQDLVAIASADYENRKRKAISVCHADLTTAQSEKTRLENVLSDQIASIRTQLLSNNPFASSLLAIKSCYDAGVSLKATSSLSAAAASTRLPATIPVTPEQLAVDEFAANPWSDTNNYEQGPDFSSIFLTWSFDITKEGDKPDYNDKVPTLTFSKVRALPVPESIKRTRTQIAAQQATIDSLTNEINGYRRELTNMASVERQARAAIATATLSTSEQGNRLLNHLLGTKNADGTRGSDGVQAMPLLPETTPTFKPQG